MPSIILSTSMEALTLLNNQLHHYSTVLEELSLRADSYRQTILKKTESLSLERESRSRKLKEISELKSEIDALACESGVESSNVRRKLGDLQLRNRSAILCLSAQLGSFAESEGLKQTTITALEAKVSLLKDKKRRITYKCHKAIIIANTMSIWKANTKPRTLKQTKSHNRGHRRGETATSGG
jgi:hypothetical protein